MSIYAVQASNGRTNDPREEFRTEERALARAAVLAKTRTHVTVWELDEGDA